LKFGNFGKKLRLDDKFKFNAGRKLFKWQNVTKNKITHAIAHFLLKHNYEPKTVSFQKQQVKNQFEFFLQTVNKIAAQCYREKAI